MLYMGRNARLYKQLLCTRRTFIFMEVCTHSMLVLPSVLAVPPSPGEWGRL